MESENKDERDWTWPDIGSLTEFDNAGYAEAMRKLAMDTGNECYATVGIAIMMEPSNAKRAASLYERAIAAGDERYATFNLARMMDSCYSLAQSFPYSESLAGSLFEDDYNPEAIIKSLYERAIAAGDERYATGGLADLVRRDDPELARSLYERAIAAGDERYATLYLAILISVEEPEYAESLCERATSAGNESATIALMLASLEQRYDD